MIEEIQPRAIVAEPYEMRAKLLFWLKKDGHKNEIFHQPGDILQMSGQLLGKMKAILEWKESKPTASRPFLGFSAEGASSTIYWAIFIIWSCFLAL